jgi:transketolase
MTKLELNLKRAHAAIKEIALGNAGSAFADKLVEYGKKDPRVCYVGVDTMDEQFKKLFPDRAFDVGIAEQDELGMATGLAMTGMIPIVQGWSPFTPTRNFDQLRTYVARHNCKVRIITTTLGLVNCSHGTTHHDLESIALYRTVPNLTVLAAFDEDQFRQAFDAAMTVDGPVVLMGPPEIYAPGEDGLMEPDIPRHGPFIIGKAQWWKRGSDVAFVSVGPALRYTMKAAEELEADGVSTSVINMTSIKPFDADAIEEAARSCKTLISVEEQEITGGLGSAVAEIIAERQLNVPFVRIGIPDKFVEDLGDWTYTRRRVGLTSESIVSRAQQLLGGC